MKPPSSTLELPPAESPSLARRFRWLIGVAAVVAVGLAAANPGRQSHLAARPPQTHARYHNYLLFSTITVMEMDGREHCVSTGFLGRVFTWDAAESE